MAKVDPQTKKCRHTPCPEGYREWHEWAEKMLKTHDQATCPHCGLWAIWNKRALSAQEGE